MLMLMLKRAREKTIRHSSLTGSQVEACLELSTMPNEDSFKVMPILAIDSPVHSVRFLYDSYIFGTQWTYSMDTIYSPCYDDMVNTHSISEIEDLIHFNLTIFHTAVEPFKSTEALTCSTR